MVATGRNRFTRRFALILAAATVAALVGATTAGIVFQSATSQPASETFEGCVNFYTGTLRVLYAPGTCKDHELPIEWNQEGPPGPQGEQGPQGIPGPSGDAVNVIPSNQLTAVCADGDTVTGGGYEFVYDQDDFVAPYVVVDRPYNATPSQEGWIIALFYDGSPLIVDVFAICSPLENPANTYLASQNYQFGEDDEEPGDGGNDGR